jgi:putative SOS response-associated peptidase YedK
MCGRFTEMLPWPDLVRLYRLTDPWLGRNTPARYNIAPTQIIPFVHHDEAGLKVLREGRWWLVPLWAKEMPKAAMFNARIETVDTSPAFRDAWKFKRCLIPADGYYEWTVAPEDPKGKTKDPWFIHIEGPSPFSFAGLWAYNGKIDIYSCTIVTAPAEEPTVELHGRMPVILDPDYYDAWLSVDTPIADLKPMLRKNNINDRLQFHRVSREVNSSRFDGDPGCLNPL